MFPRELAVGPTELEQLLHCSSLERKRWVKEGRIPILEYRTFRKAGQNLLYPVHDRRLIFKLSQEEIQQWREEYLLQVQSHRRLGGQIAVERRKVNQLARHTFLISWQETTALWRRQGSAELALVLQLAYWTQWASRWARANHLKCLRGTKHATLYAERRDAWYKQKNAAMQILGQSSYSHLSFFRPENPDRIFLRLCEEHFEEKLEGYYENKWDFYSVHRSSIKECSRCNVNVEKDYYSLFCLEITADSFPEIYFYFHIPYPSGKTYFVSPKKLPRVDHVQQDGYFRMGEEFSTYENITHREQDVLAHLEQAASELRQSYHVRRVREYLQLAYKCS
jgi:hypothetical protein